MYRFNYLGVAIMLILSMLAISSCGKSDNEKHPVVKPDPSRQEPAKWYTDKVIDLTPKILKERITEEFDEKTAKIGPDRNRIAYKGDRPCVIDFSSIGCRFCDMMEPIIKKSAAMYAGQVYIYLFVEQNPMNGHSPMMDFFGFHEGSY
ncbi:MAG: hypothetical protein Q4A76_08970, partial [Porphyromonadaceae bacterium]|nr:hypothetical protein [Porphyromonadaceae bacterium]